MGRLTQSIAAFVQNAVRFEQPEVREKEVAHKAGWVPTPRGQEHGSRGMSGHPSAALSLTVLVIATGVALLVIAVLSIAVLVISILVVAVLVIAWNNTVQCSAAGSGTWP
jgi:Flp pilus assembly protein TadB